MPMTKHGFRSCALIILFWAAPAVPGGKAASPDGLKSTVTPIYLRVGNSIVRALAVKIDARQFVKGGCLSEPNWLEYRKGKQFLGVTYTIGHRLTQGYFPTSGSPLKSSAELATDSPLLNIYAYSKNRVVPVQWQLPKGDLEAVTLEARQNRLAIASRDVQGHPRLFVLNSKTGRIFHQVALEEEFTEQLSWFSNRKVILYWSTVHQDGYQIVDIMTGKVLATYHHNIRVDGGKVRTVVVQ